MRVEVDKINEYGLKLTEKIPASTWDMDSFDIKFIDDIELNCNFTLFDQEILVDTELALHRIITCSRCLKEVKQDIKRKFSLNYQADSLGKFLEIDKDAREEILLDFPMKVLCRPDCKGICVACGADLNSEECKCK